MQRIDTIIFDLSEVLIAGLVGVEAALAKHLGVSEARCLEMLGGQNLRELCRGEISEEQFLRAAAAQCDITLPIDQIKPLIRQNFHRRVEGMDSLLEELAPRYELVLLSDHAREWVEHILVAHPFLQQFRSRLFSFDLGQTKGDVSTFHRVLESIDRPATQCLFIDDNAGNVQRARQAGIAAIVFRDAQQLRQELRSNGIHGV